MRHPTQSLGQLLAQLIRDLGLDKKIQEHQLVARWPEVVGEQIASHSRAVTCEAGTLVVEVESASWRHELLYMKPAIIERLNQAAGDHIIHEIMLTHTRK